MRGELGEIAERLGVDAGDGRARCSQVCQTFEPAGHLRPRPRANAWRCSLRRRDRLDPAMRGAARQSRSAGAARLPGAASASAASTRRISSTCWRRSARSIRGRARAFVGGVADSDRRRCRGPRRPATAAGRSSSIPRRCRACSSTRSTSPRCHGARQEPGREGLSRRVPAERQLADPQPRPARQDHPQGRLRDRAPAGRLPAARRAPSAAAQPAHGRRRDRHARIDGQPRHRQQIHADAARRVRTALLLHRLDRRRPAAAMRIPPRPCATASAR